MKGEKKEMSTKVPTESSKKKRKRDLLQDDESNTQEEISLFSTVNKDDEKETDNVAASSEENDSNADSDNSDNDEDSDGDESSSQDEEYFEESSEEDSDDSGLDEGTSQEFGNSEENGSNSASGKTDEYEYDSSDEEDVRNTIGNIPVQWYDDYPHIGYDVQGRKLIKPVQGDALDEFLEKADDPDYWRTVKNKLTGQKVRLSEEDVKQINRIQSSTHPMGSEGLYEPWVDTFTSEVMEMPVTGRPPDKRSFIPSLWEKQRVGQMVHALKMGWMKPRGEIRKMKQNRDLNEPSLDMWKEDNEPEITKRYRMHIPAPKEPLPGHMESFNPPEEYLLDEEEEAKWDSQEPEDRRFDFKPQKFESYRSVPKYSRFINERFSRLLDLYLASRQRKMKMNVNPEDLIPKRPDKKDLQPYPTKEAMVYKGHTDMVRTISPDPSGQWLVSGSDDQTVKLWEVATGRCMKTLDMGGKVTAVLWNPNRTVNLIAAVVGSEVILINPGLGDRLLCSNTDSMLESHTETADDSAKKSAVTWSKYDITEKDSGFRVKISHSKPVIQVTWHAKGDYFACVQQDGKSQAVLIHQLSRRQSQAPFSKPKGIVQRVMFHPVHPYFFVATQQHIKVYNLVKQELHKKLQANCKYISSLDVHHGGDNILIGSYDSRLCWFDLDLSTKPYQTLKYHKKAVRQVAYHTQYPLFASASDDGSIIVSHGKVFSDQLLNPLIVTVKVLRGHKTTNHLSVLDCKFHPFQPWVFSSGADSTIRLYV
ncbi:ribosome biogenesis protein bop1 [Aplysia californica]|uniref:Ribosome biogenesis protein BOP1 homolog n=1 Tax=Aplysia californica TaxID=6500 RepID=A0ABM0JQ79_APLCA|nr:ribosome biogenesis protein bop1 [Aplysia californica]